MKKSLSFLFCFFLIQASLSQSFDCPPNKVVRVNNLHYPNKLGFDCNNAVRNHAQADTRGYHYRKACQDALNLPQLPSSVSDILKVDCRNQSDAKVADVMVCCVDECAATPWTQWVDFDQPSGEGDIQDRIGLRDHWGFCNNPCDIECREKNSEKDSTLAGEKTTCDIQKGLVCKNSEQSDGRCQNYEVRFKCQDCSYMPWTQWYSRDYPSGYGDYEDLNLLRQETNGICQRPCDVQCRIKKSKVDSSLGGQNVVCSPRTGLVCINQAQPDGLCEDYQVRFRCSECQEWPWTQWYDQSNPSGYGDIEDRASLRNQGKACTNPCDIQCRSKSTKVDSLYTGENVSCEPKKGLSCINSDQSDGRCQDYEVRYRCPDCSSMKWTPWYDRDETSGYGDSQDLPSLISEGKACENPCEIECRVKSTKVDVAASGEIVFCNTDVGLTCRNSQQEDGRCENYEVRFKCP